MVAVSGGIKDLGMRKVDRLNRSKNTLYLSLQLKEKKLKLKLDGFANYKINRS